MVGWSLANRHFKEKKMPSYTMKNKATGELKEMILSLSEREQLLSEGDWEQMLSTPGFVSNVTGTLKMAGSGWKEVLSKVKSGSAASNTIND